MDKLKEFTSLTNHAGNVGYADVAFETSPLVCSLLRVVRVSIMVLWSSVTELTLARTAGRWSNLWPVSQTSCSWEHICARAEDDGRPDRAILGKSFSRHDLVRRVFASCGLESRGVVCFTNRADESTASQPTMTWIIACSSLVSTPPRPLRDGRSGTLGVRIGVR